MKEGEYFLGLPKLACCSLSLLSLYLWQPEAEADSTGGQAGSLCGFRTRAAGCSGGSQTSLTTGAMYSFQPSQSQGRSQCVVGFCSFVRFPKEQAHKEGASICRRLPVIGVPPLGPSIGSPHSCHLSFAYQGPQWKLGSSHCLLPGGISLPCDPTSALPCLYFTPTPTPSVTVQVRS